MCRYHIISAISSLFHYIKHFIKKVLNLFKPFKLPVEGSKTCCYHPGTQTDSNWIRKTELGCLISSEVALIKLSWGL